MIILRDSFELLQVDSPDHGGEDVVQRAAAAVEAAAAAEDVVKRAAAAVEAAAAALHAASPVPGDDGDSDQELRAQRKWIKESKTQLVLLTSLFATAAIALGIASPMGLWHWWSLVEIAGGQCKNMSI